MSIRINSDEDTMSELDIVVIVYDLVDEGVYGTTYLHGEPTDKEIIKHLEHLHSGMNIEVVNIMR